jgi:hypothetical protein
MREDAMRIATVLAIGLLVLVAATAFAEDKAKPYVPPVPGTTQLLDCSNATPVVCGETYTGTNVGAPNNVEYYSCSGWLESGGEVVYYLDLDDCFEVTAEIVPDGCDLDVFILSECDENECIAYGNTIATTNCLEPGTYYIVVDGYYGAECGYTLTVTCEPCECPVPPCCPFPDACCWLDFNVEHCNLVMLPCGGAPVWEWGVPVGIPEVGCDDVVITKVLGTVLAGDYYTDSGEIAMIGPFAITDDCWCLELCHFYDTEAGYDGGNVKASTDGGTSWELITPARGYDQDAYTAPMCIPGEPVFSGHQFNTEFLRDCFDLRDYIGQSVWIGFFFGSDGSVQYPGWYIKWIKTGGGEISPVEDTSWGAIKAMYR